MMNSSPYVPPHIRLAAAPDASTPISRAQSSSALVDQGQKATRLTPNPLSVPTRTWSESGSWPIGEQNVSNQKCATNAKNSRNVPPWTGSHEWIDAQNQNATNEHAIPFTPPAADFKPGHTAQQDPEIAWQPDDIDRSDAIISPKSIKSEAVAETAVIHAVSPASSKRTIISNEHHEHHQLANWDGSWAPPPDWDLRPAFDPSTKLVWDWLQDVTTPLSIKMVIDHHDSDRCTRRFVFSELALSGHDQCSIDLMGDIVPRTWIPQRLEGAQSLDQFWDYHIGCPPKPLDTDELMVAKPWWNKYPFSSAFFHLDYRHPDENGIDTGEETVHETRQRRKGMTSQKEMDMRAPKLNARIARREQENQWRHETNEDEPAAGAQLISAERPIIIRAAVGKDIGKVTGLYNKVIDSDIECADTSHVTKATIVAHLKQVQDHSLPYIVAIEPRMAGSSEKILGIAYANAYPDSRKLYRFTAELEIFVDPDTRHLGIGNCLMDQLLSLTDLEHAPKRGYKIRGEDMYSGPVRLLSNLQIRVPFAENDASTETSWKRDWMKKWGFKVVGELRDVGVKMDQSVGVLIWSRRTAVKIDPKAPPGATD